jgi:glycosyltransferase involved in cell wall biosynthesis
MRVAFVTELFYPSIGGQEYRFMQLARGMMRRQIEVDIYTTDHLGSLPSEDHVNDISIYRYVRLRSYVKPGSRSIIQLLKFIHATNNLLGKINKSYDYIILNEMPIMHLYFIRNYINLIIDWCEAYQGGLLKFLLLPAAKRFIRGIAVSEEIRDIIYAYNSKAEITVIRTPIDVNRYICNSQEKDKGNIVYIGRLVPHKNLLNLVKAVMYINKRYSRCFIKLNIAGDGPLKTRLLQYAKTGCISVLGKVSEQEKIQLLTNAFLLAIPSLREGFPNVVAEAIASCTPILTVMAKFNNVFKFVRRHGIGFVSPSPDYIDIANTILNITHDEWLRASIREQRLREEFTEEKVITNLIRFLTRG